MLKRILLVLIPALLFPTGAAARNPKQERLRKIDWHSVKAGLEASWNQNYGCGVWASYGLGSFRNILWADAGLKIDYLTTPLAIGDDALQLWSMPLFVRANANLVRWDGGSYYIGLEGYLSIPVSAVDDIRVSRVHPSLRGYMGFLLGKASMDVYLEFDTVPQFDQKFIYETDTYDYNALRPYIFERARAGIRIGYTIYSY